ncbi:unnamed protein product [Rotaria magnacalcarata]
MKSKDLQLAVKNKYENGDSPTKIYRDLAGVVSLRTIKLWVKMLNQTGSIDLSHSPGRPRTNDRVWAISRAEADGQGAIHQKTKFPKKVMVWLGVCAQGLIEPVIIEHGIMNAERYINEVLHIALRSVNIPANAKWSQNGVTIAGGNGSGNATNQLNSPCGLFVDDDQTVTIADWWNNRIIQWKNGDTTNGQVVAGGNGEGNGLNQLNGPTDVLIDKETDSLIICDYENQRVVRWSRRSGTTQGEILIDNIHCWGLAMDKQRYIYVSHYGINEVRRYQLGEQIGTLVAGGNGAGDGLNQLNVPTYLFVDRQQNVYVSDKWNHRVIKWEKGAKEGIVVAGGQGQGNALTQLYHPTGLFVDTLGTLYVADSRNHRIMRWTQGDNKQGTVVVGGNGQGAGANQFNYPTGLSFDRHGNLYVAEYGNNRVQRFSIEKDL